MLESLQKRARELTCFYQVQEILGSQFSSLEEICPKIIQVIPAGMQYEDICFAKIVINNSIYSPIDSIETKWVHSSDIICDGVKAGELSVYYTQPRPDADIGPFLEEEIRLIQTISGLIGQHVIKLKTQELISDLKKTNKDLPDAVGGEWPAILDMIKQTDRDFYYRISRKMLIELSWGGVKEAEKILESIGSDEHVPDAAQIKNDNFSGRENIHEIPPNFGRKAFQIAQEHLSDGDILNHIQRWIEEDKLGFLSQVVNRNISLAEVADAIRRYYERAPSDPDIDSPSKWGIQISLIRRFLSDQMPYIDCAKNVISILDVYNLLEHIIFSAESRGTLGGKSASLFLADQIIKKKGEESGLLKNIKTPKTWYMTSDIIHYFVHHNNFDEIFEQKYKDKSQIRLEYPYIVSAFKDGQFPKDIINRLSVALDDFKEYPLIVRSSSLLENFIGTNFSGKYKSIFLANQGNKQRRLKALMNAVAEVYSTIFSPDAIEYRIENGWLDYSEEMGIMIQEVVGTRIGKYFLPIYSGMAFSDNEYRWSPQIKREDGFIRMSPGLGTGIHNRAAADYQILLAPGQSSLTANASAEEIAKYSPKKIDVINLEKDIVERLDFRNFLEKIGYNFPCINNILSISSGGKITQLSGENVDFATGNFIVTFDGLFTRTPFIGQIHSILKLLSQCSKLPVNIEFASDGKDLFLIRCNLLNPADRIAPIPIPKDLPENQIIFSAKRHVTNGYIPNITHIVYVDSEQYRKLPSRADMLAVAKAIGRLNGLLPKRQFILIGPGRWGIKKDPEAGIGVNYSDINNTAALIEVAFKKGDAVSELSFGTHFFQDLIESRVQYLPLYPDEGEVILNQQFLNGCDNILTDMLPEFTHLAHVIRLIDISKSTEGQSLQILMNSESDEALGFLSKLPYKPDCLEAAREPQRQKRDEFWRWRMKMVEQIASKIDSHRFGVVNLYVYGSTKNATAGPNSDIDIIVHFRGSQEQRQQLTLWLEGWSLCLDEMNYLRTGYRSGGLLDIQIVTDEDIAVKSSYAAKIGAVTDSARPVAIKTKQ